MARSVIANNSNVLLEQSALDHLLAATGSAACYLSPRIGHSTGPNPRLNRSPSPPPDFRTPSPPPTHPRIRGTRQAPGESPRLPMLRTDRRPNPRGEPMKYTTSPAAVDRAGKGSAWDFILLNMSAPPRPDGPEPDGMTTLDEGLDSPTEDAGASAEELQEVEKKPMQFEGTSLPQYVSARRSNRKDLGVMRAFDPPPEPNIAAICRDTYQATWTQREQLGTETAYRRHERDVAMRRKTRKKAAAWRRASEARDKQEHEQLKAEREAQELAKQKEQELVNHRIKMRKIRWLLVMKRLNEETRSKREETAASLRIDTKRKAQLLRKRLEKMEQKREARKLFFEALPLQRRRLLEEVFTIYDSDGSGSLQGPELCDCLLEMGFRGNDPEERRAVDRICENALASNLQAGNEECIDLHELSADIIPGVCRHLNKLRKAAFFEGLSEKTTEDGSLDFEQVLESVKEIWAFEGASADDSNPVQVSLMEELDALTHQFVEEKSNLPVYTQNVQRLSEDVNWNSFAIQQELKVEHDLRPDVFRQFRSELTQLDRTFKSLDSDQSGKLDKDECTKLFKELGLVPKTQREKEEIMLLLNRDMQQAEGVDFEGFLHLITRCRRLLENRLIKKLKNVYPPWGVDEEASIARGFLTNTLLKDLNVAPRCRAELRVVNAVIREADVDGDDRYTLHEVMKICRKSEEYLRQMRLQEENDAAKKAGLSEKEQGEARWAFEQLDSDGSGGLDKTETKKALAMLGGKSISNKHFAIAFERLDSDRSGSLELPEFFRLLDFMRNPSAFMTENDKSATDEDSDNSPRGGMLQAPKVFSRAMDTVNRRASEL